MQGIFLVAFLLIFLGFSPIPVAAQEAVTYQRYQRPGQATTTTREEKVNQDGTKTTKETTATESHGSTFKYSGLPGKFIRQGGQSRSQGKLITDRQPRRTYRFEFAARGMPQGSNPTEAYWFQRKDGKFMMVDPLVTQRYSGNPR
ncbi:MAG: hypothetical protein P8168_06095 [Deltaproteobacteria bacterium]